MDDLLLQWIPYKFTNPSPAELVERRRQLDNAGLCSWLSPLVILLIFYFYRKTNNHLPRFAPSSTLYNLQKRLSWYLSSTSDAEYGSVAMTIFTITYSLWLHVLIFRKTGNDYMHLTKSFAHVSIAQLPFHYLLSIKSPSSPITLMTGLTHERLNTFHRNLGGIMFTFLLVHAVMYINFFIQKDILQKRVWDGDVQLGMLAFSLVAVLGFLTKPFVRRKYYHSLFYMSHLFIGMILPVVVFFHVPYWSVRLCVGQAWLFGLANRTVRGMTSERVKGMDVEFVSGQEMVKVTARVSKASFLTHWIPGQHIYLHAGASGPKTPFTIVSIGNTGDSDISRDVSKVDTDQPNPPKHKYKDTQIVLVLRNTGGPQTSRLANMAKRSDATPEAAKVEFYLEGPYGEASEYMPDLLRSFKNSSSITNQGRTDRVLLVAGGVGATYTIPILEALIRSITNGKSTANANTKTEQLTHLLNNIKFIWIVRSEEEAQWGITILQRISTRLSIHTKDELLIEIYITTNKLKPIKSSQLSLKPKPEPPTSQSFRTLDNGIKLFETSSRPSFPMLIKEFMSPLPPSSSSPPLPPSSNLSQSPLKSPRNERIHVLTCGPPSMVSDLRKAIWDIDVDVISNQSQTQREWVLREEQFGFGGS